MDIEAILQWAAMGRHGLYVWLAYGASLVTLAGLGWQTHRADVHLRRELLEDLCSRREGGTA